VYSATVLATDLSVLRCTLREKNCPVKTAPFSTMNSFRFCGTYIVSIFTFFVFCFSWGEGGGGWGNKKFQLDPLPLSKKPLNKLFKTINFLVSIAVVTKCGPHEVKKVSLTSVRLETTTRGIRSPMLHLLCCKVRREEVVCHIVVLNGARTQLEQCHYTYHDITN